MQDLKENNKHLRSQQQLFLELQNFQDGHHLELFAKSFLKEELFNLLPLFLNHPQLFEDKLNPILAGLNKDNFYFLIQNANEKEIEFLKKESKGIPLQYHLRILAEDQIHQIELIDANVLSLEMIIDHIDLEKMGLNDTKELFQKIDQLSNSIKQQIEVLKKALNLAWNSDREDLIENLSHLKETVEKYDLLIIGHPSDPKTKKQSTGLYKKLERHLSEIYGDLNHLQEVRAIDALGKLSIWQPSDYFEIGLLENLKNKEALDLDKNKYSEIERAEYKEKLTLEAEEKLKSLNIQTLNDLKKHLIYSKKGLKELLGHHSFQ